MSYETSKFFGLWNIWLYEYHKNLIQRYFLEVLIVSLSFKSNWSVLDNANSLD